MVEPTMTDMQHKWLVSIPEACAGLGVGRSTFYEMVTRGDVEVVRIGRRTLVPVAAIESYVQTLRFRAVSVVHRQRSEMRT